MSKIKVGIIGTGRIGRMHTENVVNNIKNVEVVAVADVFADKIEDWAHGLGISNVYKDYNKILENPEIKAVLIFTSTDTHAKIIIDSAKAGKDIFCEKPIDTELDKIYAALDAVKKYGVKLQLGFNRRFDHNFKAVRDAVAEGKIGEPQIIKITNRDPALPDLNFVKASGGIFMDFSLHDIDMARYLCDSEIVEVFADAEVLIDPAIGEAGDYDTAILVLKLKNGALALVDNSRQAVYGYDQRVEVFGSKGCITVENDKDSSLELSTVDGVFTEKPKPHFIQRYKGCYIEEMKGFFHALENNEQPVVTGEDCLKAVLVAKAAYRSLEEGKLVKVEY